MGKYNFLRTSIFVLLFVPGYAANATTYKARDITDFNKYINQVQPGDTILLLNGIWKDAGLVITSNGSENKPIVITAETPGKVQMEGNSFVKLGGNYIEVSGLLFTNGFTPGAAVIEFRTDANHLANQCRVYNCVIYNYNNPNRMKEDFWVLFYGRHNRFDHNYTSDKKNLGPVLVVELNDVLNQQNFHRIDHNYFGTRARIGGNAGEIIRLANATFSLSSSNTIIENNFFYHCDGEAEIVSIKASDNIVRGNTFYESEGSLVLRHGNRNTVEGNYFIGNDKPFTGGLRIVNYGHKIINNYFYKLKGERFRAALILMNGVPNSPLIRYEPVKDVVVAGNTFIDCDNIELSAGRDFERTAVPKNILMAGNIFFHARKTAMLKAYDDISGFSFKENWSNAPQLNTIVNPTLHLEKKSFWPEVFPRPAMSASLKKTVSSVADAEKKYEYTSEKVTGPGWFDKSSFTKKQILSGKRITVTAGLNTIYDAALKAASGDTLILADNEKYLLSKTIDVAIPLHIKSDRKSIVQFDGEKSGFAFFSIENGGSLSLSNIYFDGTSKNGVAENIIRTSKQPAIEHYKLKVDRCVFTNLGGGRAFTAYPATFADTIVFSNCFFNDVTGNVISLAAEKDDKGYYNVEHIYFKNCVFNKVLYGAIDVYRGGIDESSLGPFVTIDHCTFNNVGNAELGFAVRLHGVQYSDIRNTLFNNSGKSGRAVWFEDFGWTKNSIRSCNLYQSGRIQSFYSNVIKGNITQLKPVFVDESKFNFQLTPAYSLKNKGTDGKEVGAVWVNGELNLNDK